MWPLKYTKARHDKHIETELAASYRKLLEVQDAKDYADSMILYYEARILRLSSQLAPVPGLPAGKELTSQVVGLDKMENIFSSKV